jgi:hypothetical protein
MPLTTTMLNPSLGQLLEDAQRFAPSYGGGLSNHLPMTLIALHGLGADSSVLAAHALRYAKRLEPQYRGDMQIDHARFERYLGDWSAHMSYREFFAKAIAQNGFEQTLAAWWPQLAPGIAAAGFHGLIRTAYGIDAKQALEQASGLAYLASAWTPLIDNDSPIPAGFERAEVTLTRLREHFGGRKIDAGLIMEELRLATEEPNFFSSLRIPLLDSAEMCAMLRHDISRIAVRIYLADPTFNSLHLVTGTHALEIVLDKLPDAMHARTLAHYWVAFCAGYVGIGAPVPADIPTSGTVNWQPAIDVALNTPNDHTIKMVHTCRAQFARHGDAAYAAAALQVSGRA